MKLDRRYQRQKHNILMIVFNCPAHPNVSGLKNIKVAFLLPNTTSQLQPMDQGVIRSLKAHYRSKLLNKMIAAIDSNQSFSVTLLDSLYYIQAAWGAVNQSTLVNCFKKVASSVPVKLKTMLKKKSNLWWNINFITLAMWYPGA